MIAESIIKGIVYGVVVSALLVLGALAFGQSTRKTIELKDATTVVFRGEVDSQSVAKVSQELLTKSAAGKPLVLVMDTPGGSVVDGNTLIDFIQGLPVRVDTLTVFAASMGFQIVQNGSNRMIVPSGVLMSHRMAGGIQGQIPGELNSRLDFWGRIGKRLDEIAAKRMGVTLKEYRSMIQDEYWVEGQEAVNAKAADQVVNARCNQDMNGTSDEIINTMFGPIKITFSKCPLISGPLAISFGSELGREAQADAIKLVTDRYGHNVKK